MENGRACKSFSMRSDTFYVEDAGASWVLQVFDVPGEEDVFGITLKLGRAEDYPGFQKDFHDCLQLVSQDHEGAALCPACRLSAGLNWMPMFCDWVKAAYAVMSPPPTPVEDVPDVVRLSFESLVLADDEDGPESPLS